MVNEAAQCLDEQIVTEPWEIDIAMIMGTGFPPFRGGPLRWADTLGIGAVTMELQELATVTGGAGAERFRPHPYLVRLAGEKRGFYSSSAAPAAEADEASDQQAAVSDQPEEDLQKRAPVG